MYSSKAVSVIEREPGEPMVAPSACVKILLLNLAEFDAQRVLPYMRSGAGGGGGGEGLDLASTLVAKFGVRSPNKRKNLGNSCTTIGRISI